MTMTVDDSAGSGQAITNDVTNVAWTMPSNVQDVTGLDKSAIERLYLLADFTITLNGVFNDASNLSHIVFKSYRTLAASQTGRTTVAAHSGQTLTAEVIYTGYDMTRAADGSLVWTAPGSLSNGTAAAWS